ncbi:hypothetical protein LCGC14_1491430 [marine sediment metagenome]|uniref:Holin n=1 Tax=marine sediment metagenome TaxID=412755 RepID=A0A0F9LM67_9ZZZZ
MDTKQIVKWLIPVIARGLAWVLAAKLGLDAAQVKLDAATAAEALGALALVGMSIYSSLKGRKDLLAKSQID